MVGDELVAGLLAGSSDGDAAVVTEAAVVLSGISSACLAPSPAEGEGALSVSELFSAPEEQK